MKKDLETILTILLIFIFLSPWIFGTQEGAKMADLFVPTLILSLVIGVITIFITHKKSKRLFYLSLSGTILQVLIVIVIIMIVVISFSYPASYNYHTPEDISLLQLNSNGNLIVYVNDNRTANILLGIYNDDGRICKETYKKIEGNKNNTVFLENCPLNKGENYTIVVTESPDRELHYIQHKIIAE